MDSTTNSMNFTSLDAKAKAVIIAEAKTKGIVITIDGVITDMPKESIDYKRNTDTSIDNISITENYDESGSKAIVLKCWLNDSIPYLSPKYMGFKETDTISISDTQFNNLMTDIGLDVTVNFSKLANIVISKISRLLENKQIFVKSKVILDKERGYSVLNKPYMLYDANLANRIAKIIEVNQTNDSF